jgi:hypothetical protein
VTTARDPRAQWANKMWYKYRLTVEALAYMWLRQDRKCASCARPLTEPIARVDHDHNCCPGEKTCGRCVRDIICDECNVAAGRMHDESRRAYGLARYLERWEGRTA